MCDLACAQEEDHGSDFRDLQPPALGTRLLLIYLFIYKTREIFGKVDFKSNLSALVCAFFSARALIRFAVLRVITARPPVTHTSLSEGFNAVFSDFLTGLTSLLTALTLSTQGRFIWAEFQVHC